MSTAPAGKDIAGEVLFLSRELKTPVIASTFATLGDQAREQGWSHEEYLAAVLGRQVASRTANGTKMRISAARFGYELSGGQRQRVIIARALTVEPTLIIADEPISSLDVSIRAEVLELLNRLAQDHNMGMLYITHDLLSARMLSDEIIVLNGGRIVEQGPALEVIRRPVDAYTKQLLDAIPLPFAEEPGAPNLPSTRRGWVEP
jgi:ABC-type glutathione transport system ATPase component